VPIKAYNGTIIFVQFNKKHYFCTNINGIIRHFMKNRTISVCIDTNSKEVIAFQSITSLANHVKVNRRTIERKSKINNVIKDIEGFIIFLDVEYRRITK
jgi:uncharacterized pyridoxamine 5'-phosphate oxidase family protein